MTNEVDALAERLGNRHVAELVWPEICDWFEQRVAALASMCPHDYAEPHTCTVLIAVHDLPHMLGLRTPPAQCVVTSPDDCQCGHDHGVSTTACDRCYWCRSAMRRSPGQGASCSE